MLKSLDVLIGLVVVILALSMAVTVVTQAITSIVNSRGRHLRRGLADLLQQLDPKLPDGMGKTIADTLLRHPLVSASSTPWMRPRLGNVVHREEFTKLVFGLAGGEGATALERSAKDALVATLEANGVADAEGTLRNIRMLALELERTSPELSHVARQNMAILRAAPSDFVAKINNWFDQTMDRTSQRFTASTRSITFAAAFIVAFGLQVDTPSIANRLAADEALRTEFVRQAAALEKDSQEAAIRASAEAAAAKAAESGNAVTIEPPPSGALTAAQIDQKYRGFLLENGIIRLPTKDGWSDGYNSLPALFGMLVTALLLTLGAPFWYGALGKLLQLRSVLAVNDDDQRTKRQSSDAAALSPR